MVRREYHINEIAKMTSQEVWNLKRGGLYVSFDGQETLKLKTTWVVDSWPYLQMFMRYPGAKITHDHVFKEDIYTSSSSIDLLSKVFWDTVFARVQIYGEKYVKDEFWGASDFAYQIVNRVYNDTITMCASAAHTLDYNDFNEILVHPKVRELKRLWVAGEISLDDAHAELMQLLLYEIDFKNNNIQIAVNADILSKRQICQMVMRGFILDINGESFKTPIIDGYADGLNNPYYRSIESRNASLSLYMADSPLQSSEYNNRQCQLACSVIGEVAEHDCGGKYTLNWKICKDWKGLLPGFYHMVNGEKKIVSTDDDFKVGDIIKLRNITRCDNPDPSRPCPVCLGVYSWIVPPKTRTGLQLTIHALKKISQSILSIKHVIASVKSILVNTEGASGIYLRLDNENKHKVFLQNIENDGSQRIRFKASDVMYINDIFNTENINDVIPSRTTAITKCELVTYDDQGNARKSTTLDVTIGGKGSPLTRDFLSHMKVVGWEIIGKKFIEVPLDGYDYNTPFIISPRRGEDIMSILKETKSFLFGHNSSDNLNIKETSSTEEAIEEFIKILYAKTKINILHASVMVRAMMVYSGDENRDYRLPRGGEPYRFVGLKEAVMNRSVGNMLAYQEHVDIVHRPKTYLRSGTEVPVAPLDGIFGE